jgi:hypothetical protein
MLSALQIVARIFALTTCIGHGSAKPSALSRASGSGSMSRHGLKTSIKTRRPLKSGTNG